jgi:acetolactate synthase I/II/III large subunit
VHLSLPSDALEGRTTATVPAAADFAPQPQPLAAGAAADLMAAAAGCQRPLVLAGPASMTRPGRAAASALQAAQRRARGRHGKPARRGRPSLGAFAEVLAQADRVLLLGKRLDFTLKFGQAPFGAGVRWDAGRPRPAETARTRAAVGARLEPRQADLPSALQALPPRRPRPRRARPAGRRRRRGAALAARGLGRRALGHAGRLHPLQMVPRQDSQTVLDVVTHIQRRSSPR